MPTYIKTGYWDKKAKAPDGWLDLNLFVQTLIPPTPPSTNIYNSDGTLTGNRTISGNDRQLLFFNLNRFFASAKGFVNRGGNLEIGQNNSLCYLFYETNVGSQRLGLRQEEYNLTPEGHNLILGDNTKGHLRLNYNQNISGFSDTLENNPANWIGLKLDFINKLYQFGQINGGNTTTLKIDDAAAFPVQVSGTNVTQNTSGAASGKFLKIKVDGVDYVIELKNPS
jgi:hypothetical protein